MVRILPRACLVALFLSPSAHSADPAPAPVSGAALEKQFRESMDLPSDAAIEFVGEDGAHLTSDEFASAMMKQGVSAAVEKDPTGKKFTLRLAKANTDAGAVPAFLPELDATNLAGQPVRSADLAGRPTLFNFFFSTCVPCIKEVPFLNEFRRKHAEYNYVAVTFDPVPERAASPRSAISNGRSWPTQGSSSTPRESTVTPPTCSSRPMAESWRATRVWTSKR
jgi:thiol-disulfide isomerase/thioredoxin